MGHSCERVGHLATHLHLCQRVTMKAARATTGPHTTARKPQVYKARLGGAWRMIERQLICENRASPAWWAGESPTCAFWSVTARQASSDRAGQVELNGSLNRRHETRAPSSCAHAHCTIVHVSSSRPLTLLYCSITSHPSLVCTNALS